MITPLGRSSMGNIAPERKKIGIMMKFIISGNACMSSSREAIAVPAAVNSSAIMYMYTNARGKNSIDGRNPMNKEITRTTIP